MIDSLGTRNETAEVFWYIYSIISGQNKHTTAFSAVGENSLDRRAAFYRRKSKFRRRLFNINLSFFFRFLHLLFSFRAITPSERLISQGIFQRWLTFNFVQGFVLLRARAYIIESHGGISLSSRIGGESGTLCAPCLLVSCINIVNIFSAEKGQSCQSAKAKPVLRWKCIGLILRVARELFLSHIGHAPCAPIQG